MHLVRRVAQPHSIDISRDQERELLVRSVVGKALPLDSCIQSVWIRIDEKPLQIRIRDILGHASDCIINDGKVVSPTSRDRPLIREVVCAARVRWMMLSRPDVVVRTGQVDCHGQTEEGQQCCCILRRWHLAVVRDRSAGDGEERTCQSMKRQRSAGKYLALNMPNRHQQTLMWRRRIERPAHESTAHKT